MKNVSFIKVPGHYTWRGENGYGQFPKLYKYVEEKIFSMPEFSGKLFLVGAGIFGKYYCALIKSMGGVALDVGSVFDSWEQKGRPEAVSYKNINLSKFKD